MKWSSISVVTFSSLLYAILLLIILIGKNRIVLGINLKTHFNSNTMLLCISRNWSKSHPFELTKWHKSTQLFLMVCHYSPLQADAVYKLQSTTDLCDSGQSTDTWPSWRPRSAAIHKRIQRNSHATTEVCCQLDTYICCWDSSHNQSIGTSFYLLRKGNFSASQNSPKRITRIDLDIINDILYIMRSLNSCVYLPSFFLGWLD